jgi:hypothetical protein
VPGLALLLLLAPALLPEYRNPEAERIDLWSVVLSLGAVLAEIYGLKQIAQDGVEGFPCSRSPRGSVGSRSTAAVSRTTSRRRGARGGRRTRHAWGCKRGGPELPGDLGAPLLDSAREAFTSRLQGVAVIGAMLPAVLAVLVAIVFRQLRVTPDVSDEPNPAAALEPAS